MKRNKSLENNLLERLADWVEYRIEHKYADAFLTEEQKEMAIDDEIENLISVLDYLLDKHEPTITGS